MSRNKAPPSNFPIVHPDKHHAFAVGGKTHIAVYIFSHRFWLAPKDWGAQQGIKPGHSRCGFTKIDVIPIGRKSRSCKSLSSARHHLRIAGGTNVAQPQAFLALVPLHANEKLAISRDSGLLGCSCVRDLRYHEI